MTEDLRVKLAKLLKPNASSCTDETSQDYVRRRAEIERDLTEARNVQSKLKAETSSLSRVVRHLVTTTLAHCETTSSRHLYGVEKEKAELMRRLNNLADEIRSYPQVVEISNEVGWIDQRRLAMLSKTERLQKTIHLCKERYAQASARAEQLSQDLKGVLKHNLALQHTLHKAKQQSLHRLPNLSMTLSPISSQAEQSHQAWIDQLSKLRSKLDNAKTLVTEAKHVDNSRAERLYSYEAFFKNCMKASLRSVLKTSLLSFEGSQALYFELFSRSKASSGYTGSLTPEPSFVPSAGSKAASKSGRLNRSLRKDQGTASISRRDFMRFDLTQVIWLLSLRPDVTNDLHSAIFPKRLKASGRASKTLRQSLEIERLYFTGL
jgi:hypothetical protein